MLDEEMLVPSYPPVGQMAVRNAFESKTATEQLYAHHLSRAAWYGARVILRQVSPESTSIYDFIIEVYTVCKGDWKSLASRTGISGESLQLFLEYAAVFLGNIGNYYPHHGRGDQKFVPRINPVDLEKLSSASVKAAGLFARIRERLYSRRPSSLGFPSEIAQSSYYPGDMKITRQEIERVSRILETKGVYPENTRIQKTFEDGHTVYKILQASTEVKVDEWHISVPDSADEIVVTQGDHANELLPVCQCLAEAREYTANPQQKAVIGKYLETFKTGKVEAFKDSQRLWNLTATLHGTRAEIEGIVAFVNTEETKVLTELVNSSAKYICDLPWAKNTKENNGKGPFEKELFEPPDFTSLQTLAYCSSIVFSGINLPNFNDIRQDVGFKNVMVSNQIAAEYSADRGNPAFIDPSEATSYLVAEYDSFYIRIVLHELLGHGTLKLLTEYPDGSYNFDVTNPPISPLTEKPITTWYKPGQSWTGLFGDLATSLDECRAECVGAYLMDNEKLLQMFGFDESKMSAADITYTVYLQVGKAGLSALENYIEDGDRWGQAHSRAHFAMFRVLMDASDDFLTVRFDTASDTLTVHIDRSKVLTHGKPAIGDLLLKLHIYRCTADVVACRKYFEALTRVEGVFATWRKIVIRNKRPRQLLVQANTFLGDDGKVILREYEPSVEGMIQSWAERGI